MGSAQPYPNTPSSGGSWSNRFATGTLIASRAQTFAGQNACTFYRHHSLPMLMGWDSTSGAWRQKNVMAQVGYVGSRLERLA